jgi:glycosyltransferase involved in cell wall biosynthesis
MNPTKRIRILVTVPHLNRTASPYREMMAIAKHICKREFDLTICTLRNAGHEETGPRLASLGVPWFLSVFRPRNRRAGEIVGSCQAQREIERHGHFDIQHSLDFTSSPAEAMGARVRGTQYIYNQRNMNENGHPFALRMKFRLSNKIVSIADHITEFLLREGAPASKIVKIPNGIDLEDTDRELAAAGNCEPQDRILVLGQIEPRKRHQDIIKAMSKLIEKHPNLRLSIAGNVYHQDYLNGLKQLANELGLAGKVEFLGGRDDVPALLRQSKALVLCSESEGLPWVILEAMAARLPFVGSNIGAHREVVRHERTGLLAPLGEPDGFATALDRVLSNPEFAARLTTEARARVESDFSAARMVRETEEMYRGMMARKLQTDPANATLAARSAE